jgi:(R,R)-butanediol dehydrogenase / meso-butanediol dehydrogenase / diacetyl reductase
VDGGLAEYVTSPAAICHLVPDACEDNAAAMTQPLAVALHALSRVSQGPGDSVAVIGAGGIGSFIVAGAAQRGAEGRVVAIDIDEDRLATARALGAGETANATGEDLAELLLELSDGVGFDIVIEASGSPHAPAAAIAGTRRGGRVLLVGLHGAPRPIDLTRMILREVDLFTTVAHVCDSDIPAALELLARSDVAAVTAGPRIPLDALVEDGLRPLAERRAAGKILVTPGA